SGVRLSTRRSLQDEAAAGLELEFEVELVRDRYAIRYMLRDRRLELAARLSDGVTMEGNDLHAPAVVELQCTEVVVCGDQPEPCAACNDGGLADPHREALVQPRALRGGFGLSPVHSPRPALRRRQGRLAEHPRMRRSLAAGSARRVLQAGRWQVSTRSRFRPRQPSPGRRRRAVEPRSSITNLVVTAASQVRK